MIPDVSVYHLSTGVSGWHLFQTYLWLCILDDDEAARADATDLRDLSPLRTRLSVSDSLLLPDVPSSANKYSKDTITILTIQ